MIVACSLQVYAIARTLSAFLHEYTYIRALAFEIPELLVYVATGWLLRLRNFEPFETIELSKASFLCVFYLFSRQRHF